VWCAVSPRWGLLRSDEPTHGFRRGLHSCAASRLESEGWLRFSRAYGTGGGGTDPPLKERLLLAVPGRIPNFGDGTPALTPGPPSYFPSQNEA